MPATHAPRIGRLASAAVLLSVSFVLSRILGVVRLSVIAAVFGDTRPVEAYWAAFRIPDAMFMLASGGALASAFVPLFAGLLEQGDAEAAWRTAGTVLSTVLVALAALAALSFLFAPQIMGFLVGGGFTPAERSLTVDLTRIMLLQPIFLGASAMITSILQTYHRFLLTALAPLIYNAAIIIGALLGHTFGIGALAWAVVAGAVAQLAIQVPGMFPEARTGLHFSLDWASPAAQEVLRLFTPRVVGLAAFQAMLFITTFLAARLPQGELGAVNFSWPIMQFPVGALGLAAGAAIFPTLSRLSSVEDMHAVARTVNRSLRFVLFLAIPATVGLIVLRRPIVEFLYSHSRDWTAQYTDYTAFALLFFALAVAPAASVEVLARVFYALRDTITPVRVAIVSVVLDAALSILFVHLLPPASGVGGLAMATAIATGVQVLWLAYAADRRLGGIGRRSLFGAARDSGIASLAMGLVLYVATDLLLAIVPQHGLGIAAVLLEGGVLGVGTFAGVCYLLGAPELWELWGLVRSVNRRNSDRSTAASR